MDSPARLTSEKQVKRDFIGMAGSVVVPAAKRGTPWDEVLRQTRRARSKKRR